MMIEVTITIELERSEGPFAGGDEMAEKVLEELEAANPDTLEGDSGGEYEVVLWDVDAQFIPVQKAKKKA